MKKTYVILTRIFLGIVFFTSGMAKLFYEHKFPGVIGPVWLEDQLLKYNLDLYARFIGYSQIVVGLLLLTQRFATLGAIMLFPMILNILMVTISLKWQGTPYVNAFLLLLNISLLVADYHKLKFMFIDDPGKIKNVPFAVRRFPLHDIVFVLGVIIVLVSPVLSFANLLLGYSAAAVGLIICIGVHLYDKASNK